MLVFINDTEAGSDEMKCSVDQLWIGIADEFVICEGEIESFL